MDEADLKKLFKEFMVRFSKPYVGDENEELDRYYTFKVRVCSQGTRRRVVKNVCSRS